MPTNLQLARQGTPRFSDRDLRVLGAAIAGAVVIPGDPGFDEARTAWNLAVDQRPAAVAQPENAADVAAIVDFARSRGLRVAPQGTGHAAAPLADRLEDSILVRSERMRSVEIDPAARRARAEAGAVWIDVTAPAAEHGLAALAGSSADVGVVGYTTGGGMSWLSRRHGLAANSVTAVELVTASGELVRATRESHPDLFWAVRGGGGSFGVVTAIEFELFPLTHVYAGAMFWPQERAREILHAWRQLVERGLPDEITTVGRVLNPPPLPEVPEPLRGKRFVVVEAIHLGDASEGAELLAPLRALGPALDTVATIPAAELWRVHMDPEHPVPGVGDGMLIDAPTAEMVDAFVGAATGEAASALLSAELRQLGGALARSGPDHGATGSIEAECAMFAVGAVPVPELRPVVEQQLAGLQAALAPYEAGHSYLNFTERAVDSRKLYADEYTHRRLQAIKAAYDPCEVIQSNHPIAPVR